MTDANKILANLAVFHNGDWAKINSSLQDKKLDFLSERLSDGMDYITLLYNDYYPEKLKIKTGKPPFVLFYKGDLSLLKNDNILSVISSRNHSDDFDSDVDTLLKDTDRVLICGGSLSDSSIIKLTNKIIAVLPCGIDYKGDYTALVDTIVSNGGLVLSEYPKDTPPSQNSCMFRNRIIEGIARDTLVIEARNMSGSLVRLNLATQFNNNVFVVPKRLKDSDFINNELIYEGATPCYSKEVLKD